MTDEETAQALEQFTRVTDLLFDVPINVKRIFVEMLLTDCHMQQLALTDPDAFKGSAG